MIRRRTVLVLGAGASSNYGFPLGRGLRDLVCGLRGQPAQFTPIVEAGHSLDILEEFVRTLRHYGVSSVDWFLEDHPEFIPVGKAAMAACLIPFENHDRLFPPQAPEKHWYELLFNALLLPDGSFDASRLKVVTFNYDRSLEYYLFTVFLTRLKSLERVRDVFRDLEIIHVHGALGALSPLEPEGRRYAPELTAAAVAKAAEEIIVVGEAKDSSAAFERAAMTLGRAERIVFLGFGFHPASVRRLQIFNEPWDDARRAAVEVLATSRGLPAHVWERVRTEVLNGAVGGSRAVQPVYDFLYQVAPLDA